MKRVLLVAVAVLIAMGGAALAGNRPVVREPAEQPVKMRVELTQGRVDEVRHTVQISMNNDGPAKITVERIELRAPSFKGVGPVQADAPLPVGGLRVDVPVSYGTGICQGDELKPRSAASHVAFQVRTEDGEDELRIPIIVDGERCTPHALAEIKKPYVFPAFISLDGGAPLYTELKITGAEQAAFKPVIDACAAGHTQM